MRVLTCISLSCFLILGFPALALEQVAVRSRSGQFIVRGFPLTAEMNQRSGSTNVFAFVRLDPRLFAISCETIKAAVLQELGIADQWRGTIAVSLHPNERDNENVEVASIRYKTTWGYQVNVPERVSRKRIIKAMVEVMLLEIANRRAGREQRNFPYGLGRV